VATLEEALAALDRAPEDALHVVPCNCKAMVYYHNRPTEVCVRWFGKGVPNSEFEKGHGRPLTREEARALIIDCNKKGLMQVGEYDGFCNCDGECCYPLKMARARGSRHVYPRAHWDVSHDKSLCVDCGRCAKVCNFGAFHFDAYKKMQFDPDRCWGCTVCATNCPKKAITLTRKPGVPAVEPHDPRAWAHSE